MKLRLWMNSDTLFCVWILVFAIGIIEVSTKRKWCFLFYFSSFNDYWIPTTGISLVHTLWGEIKRCEKRAFQLLEMRKKKISWNIKSKCVTEFLLTGRSSSMKDYICHYDVSTKKWNVYINFNKNNENLEIFVYT